VRVKAATPEGVAELVCGAVAVGSGPRRPGGVR